MAVSQKQVAERLGVSIALVSRVLSGKAEAIGIAPDTIDRVVKAAREMGYVPNAAALTLKGKSTRTIGVAVYDFNDPFFGALIRQIQILAHENDYSLVLAGFLNRVPDEQDLLALHKHSIDGLLVLGSDAEAGWLRDFRHLPVARIGHGSDAEESVRISIDEEDAARQLVGHLAASGRENLLCISSPQPAQRLRRAALEQAVANSGMRFSAVLPEETDPFAAGQETVRNILEAGLEADALVCATDRIAMGALHALAEAGIDVPGQVAVTGFDDIPFASEFIPALTTVRQPLEEMVRQAFHAIIDPHPPQTASFPGTFVARQTA
jgi:LacI family transcriptional regulator